MRSIIRAHDRSRGCLYNNVGPVGSSVCLYDGAVSLYDATRLFDCVDDDGTAPADHRGSMKTLWNCSSILLSAEQGAVKRSQLANDGTIELLHCVAVDVI